MLFFNICYIKIEDFTIDKIEILSFRSSFGTSKQLVPHLNSILIADDTRIESDLLPFVLLRLIRIQFGSTRYDAIRILKSCLRPLSSRWPVFRPFKTSITYLFFMTGQFNPSSICQFIIYFFFSTFLFSLFDFALSIVLLLSGRFNVRYVSSSSFHAFVT